MGDSWDDDDFVVPSLLPKPTQTVSTNTKQWEEEDTLQIDSKLQISSPTPAQIEATRRKVELEETKLANHLLYAALENETSEEKKTREKKQAEEADTALAGELFGKNASYGLDTPLSTSSAKVSSSVSGLGSVSLKTKQEHINFAILCSKKLSDSTSQNVGIYYKSLTEKIKDNVATDTIEEILVLLSKVRDERKKTEAAKAKTAKKTKKEIAAENQKHNDTFGGVEDGEDKYEKYYGMEDDFM